jgi:sulfatase modifying factor 1
MNFPRHSRKVRLSYRTLATILLATGLAVVNCPPSGFAAETAEAPAGVPGLVKQRPADGRFVETEQGFMVPYKATIPGTEATFEMTPIPGGVFKMGSPASEEKRRDSEGPQFDVKVEPFWMGTYEITWSEYKSFMSLHDIFKGFQTHKLRPITPEREAYVITAPSNLYDPSFTFVHGSEPRQPAVTMSQYAAKQYTKWVSGLSGQFYRLPSEAEWEYACRAGSTTAFQFGDDPSELDEYGWYFDNAEEITHEVGQKKPNAWGLYDMHGNVGEWVLDQYVADHYKQFEGKTVAAPDAIAWPTKLYPRVVRGGSWDHNPKDCRSAARQLSHDDEWRDEDPNFPQSPWWFTSGPALGVGFRIIRPLNPPAQTERPKYWEADIKQIQDDVRFRIDKEGRGARGVADPTLPEDIQKLQEAKQNANN